MNIDCVIKGVKGITLTSISEAEGMMERNSN